MLKDFVRVRKDRIRGLTLETALLEKVGENGDHRAVKKRRLSFKPCPPLEDNSWNLEEMNGSSSLVGSSRTASAPVRTTTNAKSSDRDRPLKMARTHVGSDNTAESSMFDLYGAINIDTRSEMVEKAFDNHASRHTQAVDNKSFTDGNQSTPTGIKVGDGKRYTSSGHFDSQSVPGTTVDIKVDNGVIADTEVGDGGWCPDDQWAFTGSAMNMDADNNIITGTEGGNGEWYSTETGQLLDPGVGEWYI